MTEEREQFPVGTVLVSTGSAGQTGLIIWKSEHNGWRLTALDGAILDRWYKSDEAVWNRMESGQLRAVFIPPDEEV